MIDAGAIGAWNTGCGKVTFGTPQADAIRGSYAQRSRSVGGLSTLLSSILGAELLPIAVQNLASPILMDGGAVDAPSGWRVGGGWMASVGIC